ncbi:MerR family transcriptional regulator [Paenibacillus pasadenensis]|uniref:Transcriptional regulator, MerR family n=1 Tax=Paenibacillus pasadenensis TaxID=217090 RepID=A0A2N5N4R6_9BACL|nr:MULTISPECIES: MerR family transcriptional regulator [Paenibacillus]PLT45346.1 Transcriptional regulator, MerR family [Paenibacillus pasadenensis]QGG55739.1 MerR family transcriptional regulator [Paenibacillus sp. B01]
MAEQLLKIGELSKQAEVSSRTIDYYTKLGLIQPEARSEGNYRLYSRETLERLQRIEQLKKEKYTLDEIKQALDSWTKVSSVSQVTQRLSDLELHLTQLEREVKELEPVIQNLKPKQANQAVKRLIPQTAACIEALMLILNKGNFM